jgi:hypothetical protein
MSSNETETWQDRETEMQRPFWALCKQGRPFPLPSRMSRLACIVHATTNRPRLTNPAFLGKPPSHDRQDAPTDLEQRRMSRSVSHALFPSADKLRVLLPAASLPRSHRGQGSAYHAGVAQPSFQLRVPEVQFKYSKSYLFPSFSHCIIAVCKKPDRYAGTTEL